LNIASQNTQKNEIHQLWFTYPNPSHLHQNIFSKKENTVYCSRLINSKPKEHMKLHISLLASTLIMAASMHGMDRQGEKTRLTLPSDNKIYYEVGETVVTDIPLPKPQPLPSDCIPNEGILVDTTENLNQQAFKFKQQSAQLKAAVDAKDRKFAAVTCIGAICCCPCLVLECIRDSICPTIVIVNQNGSNNNN
jgi:hypothetical protein